jgi:DNA-binding transcriptional LysR family regulator
MAVRMEWESRLGRRLRVRDLYILSTVVSSGSMAKAARQLAMSQPVVSEAIANLEHLLRVRLLERSTRGIRPTVYADAMLKRSNTVFDELRQSVRDIEWLADPATGTLTIGCPESIAATGFPPHHPAIHGKISARLVARRRCAVSGDHIIGAT